MSNLVLLCMVVSMLFSEIVFGQNNPQNKVVVIPLQGDDRVAKGIDFDNNSPSTSISSISTCSGRTVLKTVEVTVPKSKTDSYVVCRATGRTFHSQTAKWVFYSIDDELGTGNDVFAYTGVVTSTSTYNNYDPFSMQEVYTFPPEGGSDTFYLKACRQDSDTTGTAYHDDFTCEVFLDRF